MADIYEGIVESTADAVVTGLKAVKKVRGKLVNLGLTESTFTDNKGRIKIQYKGELENASVLEWLPNSQPFDLKDGHFSFFMPYSHKDGATIAKPSVDSPYMKTWVASCEAAGKKPSEFKGEFITIEQVEYPWFDVSTKNVDGTITKKSVTVQMWKMVNDEKADSPAVIEHVTKLLIGKNQNAALRELMVDQRASQYPVYKDALKAGGIETLLKIKLGADGRYEPA